MGRGGGAELTFMLKKKKGGEGRIREYAERWKGEERK